MSASSGHQAAPPPSNVHQIIQFQYRHDCQLLANGQVKDACMSPAKGQSVKGALQYNNSLRNMSDMQFMRHLGWLDSGKERRAQHHQQSSVKARHEAENFYPAQPAALSQQQHVYQRKASMYSQGSTSSSYHSSKELRTTTAGLPAFRR